MLRTWQDGVRKWQLVPEGPAGERDEARFRFDRARSALVSGRLDDALRDFQAAAALREHSHDQVGLGDVQLARGRWQLAAECYRRALATDAGDPLAHLGQTQVLVAEGRAAAALPELERMLAEAPGD